MTHCTTCNEPIPDGAIAHQAHDSDCDRAMCGVCRCDGWVCSTCCPDSACVTPLAALLQEANRQHRETVAELDEDDAA